MCYGPTGGSARATQPGQLPSTGNTGLTFKQLQITPVLDGSATPTPSQGMQLSLPTSSHAHSKPQQSILRPHANSPSSALPLGLEAGGEALQGSRKLERAAQLEAMLALHAGHSGPVVQESPEADDDNMAQDGAQQVLLPLVLLASGHCLSMLACVCVSVPVQQQVRLVMFA